MNLFGDVDAYLLTLTPEEAAVVAKPVPIDHGVGGWQAPLLAVQQRLEGGCVELTDQECRVLHRLAERGSGGYQQRAKILRSAAWRAGWPGMA